VLRSYDQLGELILWPALIAARGRASSFSQWKNKVGFEFSAECHYLNAANMDGYAGGDAGTCYLSVCDAVAYAMLDLFSFLFSVPTFFAAVGDSTLEDLERVANREKPAGYGFFRRSKAQVIDFERDIVAPKCSIRGLAALYFSGMAMDMIWTHELSHGVHGHIDFAKASLGLRALNEQPRGEGDLRLMPMEAEADRFAVISIVQTAMVGDAAPYLPRQLASLSPEIRVTSALVVAALLTWFWAFQQRIDRTYDGFDPYTTGSHPPPLVRLHIAFDVARQFLSQQGWTITMIEKIVFEAMINLEALAAAKSWFSILDPARSFGEQANGFVRDVKRIMGDSYREIEASLAPYRFSKPSQPNEPLNSPSPVLK
jgi:hypothetical protein